MRVLRSKQSLAGQALIIGLLFVVVVSTLVLALISRSLKDVKVSTETKEELRAFSAAEAGLEKVLNDPGAYLAGGGTQVTIDDIQVDVTTQEALWSDSLIFTFPDEVKQDEVRQFFLSKYNESTGQLDTSKYYDGGKIDIWWGRVKYEAGTASYVPGPNQPGVEVTLYYDDGGTVKILRQAFDKDGRGGFDTDVTTVASSEVDTTFGKRRFAYRATFDYSTISGVPLFLRVRFLFNGPTPHPLGLGKPTGVTASYYPPQGYKIFSQAQPGSNTAGAVQRLEAFKSYPVLPAIFDYAIFSGSNLEKP